MKKYTLINCLISTLIMGACAPKEMPDLQLEERIGRIENGLVPALQIRGEEKIPTYNIKKRLEELGIPGLSVAVAVDGKVAWSRAYGLADISENRPVTIETMFLAGSISKPVSALRAHQLVEDGMVRLDKNVNNYLVSWKVPDNEFTSQEKVTLRRILNHTAGLTVWGFPGYDKGDDVPTVVDVLNGKGNTDSVRVYKKPGESWMYSGGGYTIMQLMITDIDKTSFPETMQLYILNSMDMELSTFENPLPQKYHSIAATGYRGDGQEVEGKWPIYPEMAAAGLWTTPSQLIQYAIHIQNIHQNKEDGILEYETVQEMLTPGMNGHGLGPGVGELTFGHGGADEGFRAQLIAWKDLPYSVVIMVNSDNGKIIRELLLSIVNEYELPGVEPEFKEVLKLSDEELQSYAGLYDMDEYGPVEVILSEGVLSLVADFIDEPVTLLAENDTLFFDRNDGTQIDFDLDGDDNVTGFNVQGLQARRVE